MECIDGFWLFYAYQCVSLCVINEPKKVQPQLGLKLDNADRHTDEWCGI